MSVQRVSIAASPLKINFKAKTKILAPEELLSKKDKEFFEKLGSKIGTDNDIIEISISNLHCAESNPDVKAYTVSKMYMIQKNNSISTIKNRREIPYIKSGEIEEKNSPFNYINTTFERLLYKD